MEKRQFSLRSALVSLTLMSVILASFGFLIRNQSLGVALLFLVISPAAVAIVYVAMVFVAVLVASLVFCFSLVAGIVGNSFGKQRRPK